VPAVADAPNTTIDSWIAVPRSLNVSAPRTMIDAWRLGVPAVSAAPAPPNRMIEAWRLAER
jgi:hypothetical protein